MKRLYTTICLIAMIIVSISYAAAVVPVEKPVPEVQPEQYPALDAKEVGALRWFVKLARQAPGD